MESVEGFMRAYSRTDGATGVQDFKEAVMSFRHDDGTPMYTGYGVGTTDAQWFVPHKRFRFPNLAKLHNTQNVTERSLSVYIRIIFISDCLSKSQFVMFCFIVISPYF